ncbi:MAG: spore coat protein CotJB [Clostridia bacterium]|nr:spore coat protein CotJB [Clostridia bacterium]
MNSNHHSPNRSCCNQLEMIRALDFAIQETVLYLDAYPHHEEALRYYHSLIAQRESAIAAYEQQCGPLTMYGNRSTTSWDWVKAPWPWESDAN